MPNNSSSRIEINPAVMLGRPVIKGTRISVSLILEKLGAGETIEQLLEANPRLTREDIQASIEYARETKMKVVGDAFGFWDNALDDKDWNNA
jgi:uncharacterized protein (DUF433 family)